MNLDETAWDVFEAFLPLANRILARDPYAKFSIAIVPGPENDLMRFAFRMQYRGYDIGPDATDDELAQAFEGLPPRPKRIGAPMTRRTTAQDPLAPPTPWHCPECLGPSCECDPQP